MIVSLVLCAGLKSRLAFVLCAFSVFGRRRRPLNTNSDGHTPWRPHLVWVMLGLRLSSRMKPYARD